MTTKHQPEIVVQDQKSAATDLTQYGFQAELPESIPARSDGTLLLGDKKLDVKFRIRDRKGTVAICSFVDLTLDHRDLITRFIKDQENAERGSNALDGRTYDQLAAGDVAAEEKASEPKRTGRGAGVKTVALVLMTLAMVALLAGTLFFLKSRSSLPINNSALSGNYIPVNSPVSGEIVMVSVSEGQYVEAGDVLMRLRNHELELANAELVARLETAKAKVRALSNQLGSYDEHLAATKQKIALNVKLAESEVETAQQRYAVTQAGFSRLQPYASSGAVTASEIDIAQKEQLTAGAMLDVAKKQLEVQQFALDASSENIIFIGDRVDTEPHRLAAQLAIAQAEVRELTMTSMLANKQSENLVIRAPRAGQIHVNYRHLGEYLRASDRVVALSVDGNVWAAGHVASNQATRVRPGQPVTVSVPSTGQKLAGVVTAVGHRALYSSGDYTADFRGSSATDVPIKVTIPDLPGQVPSGIRLDMVINTGFGVDWIDEMLGYKLQPIGTDRQSPNPAPVTTTSVFPAASESSQEVLGNAFE